MAIHRNHLVDSLTLVVGMHVRIGRTEMAPLPAIHGAQVAHLRVEGKQRSS
jgi:hypothetical protein